MLGKGGVFFLKICYLSLEFFNVLFGFGSLISGVSVLVFLFFKVWCQGSDFGLKKINLGRQLFFFDVYSG